MSEYHLMKEAILRSAEDAVKAAAILTTEEAVSFMESSAKMIAGAFQKRGKILIAGNGGSLCDAMHFAEELTGFYREKRAPLPAIALSDPGHMSCVANDSDFSEVFARLVESLGNQEDILILLTTSGNSLNLVKAAKKAKERGMKVIAFLGKTGGSLKGMGDLEWIVQGFSYSDRIQEAHMAAIHITIEMVEKLHFSSSPKDLYVCDRDQALI